ncbi:hypothetical protein [Pseudarcicella hirudinis]|nr:hypothetical protein [Pseudarcicella hirudinis]
MKKFILFMLLLCNLDTFACDLCGCANGGSFFGILPQSHRGFMGIRYRYSSFDSHLNSQLLQTREVFQSTELWGRFYPFKKTQVLAFLPYNFNAQTLVKANQTTKIQGLGDASLIMHYNVFNTFWDSTAHKIDQNLLIGGGIKLPTGRYLYDPASTAEVDNPNFQLGTGSTDFILNAIYTIRYRNWGLNTDLTYKINTENSNNYRFGNRVTTSASAFYTYKTGGITLMPNSGMYFEHSDSDQSAGVVNNRTGGYVGMATLGMESFFDKFSIGINHQQPVFQELSKGELQANARTTIHLTYLF